MKIKVGTLRRMVSEAKARTSVSVDPGYLKKEHVRELLQKMITEAIAVGDVTDQTSLLDYIATINMAMTTLKMIPFEAFASTVPKANPRRR